MIIVQRTILRKFFLELDFRTFSQWRNSFMLGVCYRSPISGKSLVQFFSRAPIFLTSEHAIVWCTDVRYFVIVLLWTSFVVFGKQKFLVGSRDYPGPTPSYVLKKPTRTNSKNVKNNLFVLYKIKLIILWDSVYMHIVNKHTCIHNHLHAQTYISCKKAMQFVLSIWGWKDVYANL